MVHVYSRIYSVWSSLLFVGGLCFEAAEVSGASWLPAVGSHSFASANESYRASSDSLKEEEKAEMVRK